MANVSTIKNLLDIDKLKEICDRQSISVLEECLDNLTSVISERKKMSESRNKKIKSILEQLSREGISPEDLVSEDTDFITVTKREKRPPKYRYMKDGVEKFWTGQGRTPAPIQQGLDEGKSLDDYLIRD